MNKAIYIGADWCGMCKACKPMFEKQCKRLEIPIAYKDAEKQEDAVAFGEIRELPYAIVVYKNKTIKGNAFDVVELLKYEVK